MIYYNSEDLVQILTKIDIDNCLWTPYKCTKFQLDWSTGLQVTAIFSSVWKDEEKKNEEKTSKVCSLISQKRFKYLNKYDWGIWKKAEPVYQ